MKLVKSFFLKKVFIFKELSVDTNAIYVFNLGHHKNRKGIEDD